MSLTRFLIDDRPIIKMVPSDTVIDAVNKMSDADRSSVLILNPLGLLEGIFTERDLMTRVVKPGLDPATTTLDKVMTKDVIVLTRTTALDHAVAIMAKNHVRHLPVEDENRKIIGVISLRHLLHDKINQVVQELKVLEDYDSNVPGG